MIPCLRILKTLFVFNKMGPNVDVVNVLSKSLRFYSIGEQKTPNYEVDLADLVLSKFNKVFVLFLQTMHNIRKIH
jgi:hypothetical protein